MTITERFNGDLPVLTAEDAIEHADDAVVATSGFGSVGYPKAVPLALAQDDDARSITVITGGSVGGEIDTELVESDVIARRFPYLGTPIAREAANEERIAFHDRHVSRLADEVQFHQLGTVDVAIIEAVAVGEDWLVPSPCIGQTPAYVEAADRLIVEVNHAQPLSLQHIHDIYRLSPPPNREPIPLTDPTERIGSERVRFEPDKLAAVVETDRRDSTYEFREPTVTDREIAHNLGGFLTREAERNPTMTDSVRLQFGVGSLGNALASTLADIDIGDRDVVYYGEVIQDGILDLLDAGTLTDASATSLALTTDGQDRFVDDLERYAEDIVLRPSELSNGAELIERFGVVAVNSALEVDLFGHVNSTHVNGTHVINGIGGSNDFNRSALISVTALPSTASDGEISRIVPMVPHVDHTEHDVDVVATEHGVADLRGKSPRERATQLVSIAHSDFRDDLYAYLYRGRDYGGHIPHDLETALAWPRDRQQER
jgi:succinyl-CoA:acetate CoA-transferase